MPTCLRPVAVMLLMCPPLLAAVDPTAFHAFISNVSVPQTEVSLDSISGGSYYYSGVTQFDILTNGDSARIHVYLEEVPLSTFQITGTHPSPGGGYTQAIGHATFRNIDSLCAGDTGVLKSKDGCTILWRYSTPNATNYCRIKVGTGNLLYVNTRIESVTQGATETQLLTYTYNSLGLLAHEIDATAGTDTLITLTKVPLYNKFGQRLVDDTTDPIGVSGYDSRGRLVFNQEASRDYTILHFINGYVYDSLSRAIAVQSLLAGATALNPGIPANVDTYTYDDSDRRLSRQHGLSIGTGGAWCSQLPFIFNGIETFLYYYCNPSTARLDSVYSAAYDTSLNSAIASESFTKYYYGPDTLCDSQYIFARGRGAPGTCWGDGVWEAMRRSYFRDSQGYNWKTVYSANGITDAGVPYAEGSSTCSRREYDVHGDAVREYYGCDSAEVISWEATYDTVLGYVTDRIDYYNTGTSLVPTRSHYVRELIDLDKQENPLYEK